MEKNMSNKKCPMPCQEPNVRNKNFFEVALGYTEEMAIEEAKRCLNCKNMPCKAHCPVNIEIPAFIAKVAEGDFFGANEVLQRSTSLAAICGRVCPQETQCESACVRGIKGESVGIGRLERFVADYCREHSNASSDSIKTNKTENTEIKTEEIKTEEVKNEEVKPGNGIKVAVVGSGPAGLTCAGDLAKMGYSVTVFEALHKAGGVLIYGIPEFRLPKDIVSKEIEKLKKMGVTIKTDMVIGKVLTIDSLFENGYKAVFIGSGAGLPRFMNIKGENLPGVYSANEYLTRINLMKAYEENCKTPIAHGKNIAVVGGGNVAMDAARCAKRMGAENVYIVYRRSLNELPARKEEVEHAMEEGIEFKLLNNPVEIIADENGNVGKMRCIKMELGEPDASGRRSPVEIKGSEFDLDVDTVIMSIGTSPNPLIRSTTPGLETNRRGCLVADENGKTSREGVFAGGDAVTGAATVILAMGAGKTAAKAIDEYIKSKSEK